jgi:monoamine oxidase
MEIIVGIAVIALVAYVLTRKKDVADANEAAPYKVETPVPAGDVAPQPEPATTPIPLVPLAVEGAGAVEVPAEAPAKKPRAKKPAAPKAGTTKAPAKPRAKKAKAE